MSRTLARKRSPASSLAVLTRCIGARSETFIRRHLEDLLPGRTVAVAESMTDGGYGGHWSVACPVLDLEALGRTLPARARSLLRRLGVGVVDMPTRAVDRFFKAHGVEAIMGEYLDYSLPWLRLAQRAGIRFFGHAHGYDISRRLRDPRWQLEYLRYNESSGVIVVSEASRARLVSLGIREDKIHVVPCGVDVPPSPVQRPARKRVSCLAVGRMVAKKGPVLTLDAFRRASEQYPDLHLDFVGEGELLPAARQFVQAFAMEDRVTLHGGLPSEAVQRLMNDADIFIQHSMVDPDSGDEEGLPVAILEAMARSLPVVSTRHAGIPEAVEDGTTGYLVQEGDSRGMAERIAVLAADYDRRRGMGLAGWQRASARFTWDLERRSLLHVMGVNAG